MGAIAAMGRSYKGLAVCRSAPWARSIIRFLHIYLINSDRFINLSPAKFCQWRKPRIAV